jgi:hypothetical protein
MKLHLNKCSNGTVKKHYIYNFKEIEDISKFNPYTAEDGSDIDIDLDPCPFCGITGILNHDYKGWFGWCSICDSRGPHHHDWSIAAKMWNSRSLAEYTEAKGIDKDVFVNQLVNEGFDSDRFH